MATWLVIGLALLAYAAFVRKYCSYYAGGADSSGYLSLARGLTEGRPVGQVRPIEGLRPAEWEFGWQRPLGYEADPATGALRPVYPPGLPLHYALAAPIAGLEYAPIVVNVGLALAAAGLAFALGRSLGLARQFAVAGAGVLLFCPLFVFMLLQPMSDVPATVWAMASVVAALRARLHTGFALAAGFSFGVAVLIRPTDAALLLPLGIALGCAPRSWLGFGCGGVPAAIFLLVYNLSVYGAGFSSGYGAVGALFAARHVLPNLVHFLCWVPLLLTPFVVIPAVAFLAGRPCAHRERSVLLAWAAAPVALYACYAHSGETWWYLRFLLPAFPPVLLSALLFAQDWLGTQPNAIRRSLVRAGLGSAVLMELIVGTKLRVAAVKHDESAYYFSSRWLGEHLPPHAIVVAHQASAAVSHYTSFPIVRWDLVTPTGWRTLLGTAAAHQRPIYAALFEFERGEAFNRVPGTWSRHAQIRGLSVWRYEAPESAPPPQAIGANR